VHCWGSNDRGQVGTGAIETLDCVSAKVPCVGKAKKVALPSAARQVSVGDGFVLVLLSDGSVVGWGEATNGQLGRPPGGSDKLVDDAGTYTALTPARISALPSLSAPP
jgi:alpha-tubulin suppressor-like RCC1 family protein